MAKKIKSIAEAIGIIEKEASRMGEDKAKESAQAKPKYCVECNGTLSHQGAYFCKLCAADFYGEVMQINAKRRTIK